MTAVFFLDSSCSLWCIAFFSPQGMFQVGCFKHFRWICHTSVNLGFKAVFKQNFPFFLSFLFVLLAASLLQLDSSHSYACILSCSVNFPLLSPGSLPSASYFHYRSQCKHYSPQILLAYLIFQTVHHHYKQKGSQSRSLV